MIERYPIEDREQWLEWRRRDITASDIGAICGLHPTRSPLTVYAEKMGALEREDSNIMRRGRWMEACFVEAFKDERPELELQKAQEYIRDPELRIGATPDFWGWLKPQQHEELTEAALVDTLTAIKSAGLIETKIVAWPEFKRKWMDDGTEDDEEDGEDTYGGLGKIIPPMHYQLQALTQAKLTDAPWAMLGVMAIDAYRADLFQCPVDLDDGAWQFVKKRVAAFWDCVNNGRPPEVMPALDEEALKALYPTDHGNFLVLNNDQNARYLLDIWLSNKEVADLLKERLKEPEARIKEAKNELKSILRNAAWADFGDYLVSWKTQTRKPLPATEFRVMRLKKVGR